MNVVENRSLFEPHQFDLTLKIISLLDHLQLKIQHFPPSLRCLIFNACEVSNRPPRLFYKIDQHFNYLEELSLENCRWFETHDFVSFSKLPHLKRLNLRGCVKLKRCVPYASIATRFGFKSLEVISEVLFYIQWKNINPFHLSFSIWMYVIHLYTTAMCNVST